MEHPAGERVGLPHLGGAVAGQERRDALDGGVVGAGEVGRAAPQLGQRLGDRVDHRAGRHAGRDALLVGRERRQVGRSSPRAGSGVCSRSKRAVSADGLRAHAAYSVVPLGLGGLAALDGLAGVLEDAGRDLEGLLGVEAEHLLGGRDLVGAERRAVGLAGVLGVRGRPRDDRVQHDEARPVGDRLAPCGSRRTARARPPRTSCRRGSSRRAGRASRRPRSGRRRPRPSAMSVLSSIEIRLCVVDQGEVAELLDAGDRGGLGGDALLDVAVGADGVDLVVERRVAERGVRVEQAVLAAGGHRHADGVADALAERTGGGLDAGGVAVLRVARGLAAPGAQRLEVVELEAPAAQEELDVEGQAGVAAGEDEAVAAGPVRVGRVVAHHLLEQQVRRRARGSSPCRGGRCRPSGRRPWPAPARCRRPCRPARSSPASRVSCSRGLPFQNGSDGSPAGPCSCPPSRHRLKPSPSLLTPGDRLRGASCPPISCTLRTRGPL